MVLKLNTKLFGSSFTVERHKEDGSTETKTVTEQCYLVGETESLHSSVAISDCDGLVRGFCVHSYPRVRARVCDIESKKTCRANHLPDLPGEIAKPANTAHQCSRTESWLWPN